MCKYCEGIEKLINNYPVDSSYIKIKDNEIKFINSFGNILNTKVINYCPMCGRKLDSQEIKTIKWIECDDSFVRICLDNKTHNSKFKLYCTARGNKGIIYAYRFNEESNQYEYCILENNKYKWINNNGYCKFFMKKQFE